jgi:hypothetical protein
VVLAGVQKLGYLTEYGEPVMLNNNVFVVFGMMMFLTAVSMLMMGLMSELLIRIYHESQGRSPYRIRRISRKGAPSAPAPDGLQDAASRQAGSRFHW